MAFNTGTIPLIQALPWLADTDNDNDDDDDDTNETSCVILVSDSVETDGRFLLHTLASQALMVNININTATATATVAENAVLWLACGPLTETLVATAMRKMGCDAAASYLKSSNNNSNNNNNDWKRPLAIYSIQRALSKDDVITDDFNEESYLKNLYHRIKAWCSCDVKQGDTQSRSMATTLIVDDVSSLSNLFGNRLVYFFLQYLRSIPNCRLILRCSNDMDRDLLQYQQNQQQDEGGLQHSNRNIVDWVGAGGAGGKHHPDTNLIVPWERTLVELTDWMIDVVPLASGYSREAHGRLVLTNNNNNNSVTNTKTTSRVPLVMNYCLQDTSVSAIRLKR